MKRIQSTTPVHKTESYEVLHGNIDDHKGELKIRLGLELGGDLWKLEKEQRQDDQGKGDNVGLPPYFKEGVPKTLLSYAPEPPHRYHHSPHPGGRSYPGGRVSQPPPHITGMEVGDQGLVQQIDNPPQQAILSETSTPGGKQKDDKSGEKNALFPGEKKSGHCISLVFRNRLKNMR
jgi:hypothetical protein